jgi:hypothetical protein
MSFWRFRLYGLGEFSVFMKLQDLSKGLPCEFLKGFHAFNPTFGAQKPGFPMT